MNISQKPYEVINDPDSAFNSKCEKVKLAIESVFSNQGMDILPLKQIVEILRKSETKQQLPGWLINLVVHELANIKLENSVLVAQLKNICCQTTLLND